MRYRVHLLDLVISLYVLQMIFGNLSSTTNLKKIIFLMPPSEWAYKKMKKIRLVVEPKLQNIICRTNKEMTKSRKWNLYLKNWASYSDFREFLRYGYNFLYVIITFKGFKLTVSNIRSHDDPLFISRGWRLAPPPSGCNCDLRPRVWKG